MAKKKLVTKDMRLGEIISNYPETAMVMAEHGLHCIGCHMSPLETLEDGASVHGMSGKDISKLVDELNKIASKKPKK
jgi:hybrid cluster-associated redox disulfide protein